MRNVNKQNLLNFFILVSLFHGIRGEFGGIKEQRKIASGSQLENNFGETPGETVITTAVTVDDEKFDDNELRKLFVQKYKWYENLERERHNNVTPETLLRRKIRDIANETPTEGHLECLLCSANTSTVQSNCFAGSQISAKRCPEYTVCYTEIHPNFINRGCTDPTKLKRTFVCKCPLCNDKSSKDPTFYNYIRIDDWEYHNQCLQKIVVGTDLICKACITRGINKVEDDLCKSGQTSHFATCATNQFCVTHIDAEADLVSRGCISMPAYNSMYIYCNATKCNNVPRKKLILNLRTEGMVLNKIEFKAADNEIRLKNCASSQSERTLLLCVVLFWKM